MCALNFLVVNMWDNDETEKASWLYLKISHVCLLDLQGRKNENKNEFSILIIDAINVTFKLYKL